MATALDILTEALVVDSVGADFKLTPIILSDMNDDEVLVEIKFSGICHTVRKSLAARAARPANKRNHAALLTKFQDIVLQQGLLPQVGFPAIFGHEGAGVVQRVGPVAAARDPALRPGATVLLSFNTCGTCRECAADRPSRCHVHPQANAGCVRLHDGSTPTRLASHPETSVRSQCFGQSSFARVSVVTARSVVVVPEELLDTGKSDNILAVYAPLGCGFQTGAGTVLNVLKPERNNSVVVFGIGSVGLAVLMAAKYLQVNQIVAVDVVDEKLGAAMEFGATVTLNSKGMADVAAEVMRITGGGVDYAIDCTGIIPVIESLVDCLQPGGTAVSVGIPPPEKKVQINALSFLMDNKRFIGVIEGGSVPQKVKKPGGS